MKAHLEAMRGEFGRIAPGHQELCGKAVAAMAQSGITALQEAALNPGRSAAGRNGGNVV